MLVKVSELTGAALDYAVAKCEGGTNFHYDTVATYWITIDGKARALAKGWSRSQSFIPSTSWEHGGPIIERENISIIRCDDDYATDSKGYCTNERIQVWAASIGQNNLQYSSFYQDSDGQYEIVEDDCIYGPTPLIAAMRCYVAAKLREEIEIPEELI